MNIEARSTTGIAQWLVYAGWAILLLDVHYFLGVMVAPPLAKLGMLILGPLVLLMLLQVPVIIASMKSWAWYPPFALFVTAAIVSLPVAVNVTYARIHLQVFITCYVVAVATVIYIRTARQALPILVMFAGRFLWFAVWARTSGYVPWHPTLSNYDGFGALSVMGVACCFWFAIGVRSPKLKVLLLAMAAYCVMGVIASYARGAFLSLLVTVGYVWWRSPRKVLTGLGVLGFAVVGAAAAVLLFDGSFFIEEMSSIFDEGTEEGTGAQRWALWGAALRVWLVHPFFGVGAGNFGAFAAGHFRVGEIVGFENPGALYGFNTHNSYVQILAEMGLVGFIAYGWIVIDFVLKNRALLKPEALAKWSTTTLGPKIQLRYIAYALEGSMLATLLSNMLYAGLLEPWLITICAANRMIWAMVSPKGHAANAAPAVRRRPSG